MALNFTAHRCHKIYPVRSARTETAFTSTWPRVNHVIIPACHSEHAQNTLSAVGIKLGIITRFLFDRDRRLILYTLERWMERLLSENMTKEAKTVCGQLPRRLETTVQWSHRAVEVGRSPCLVRCLFTRRERLGLRCIRRSYASEVENPRQEREVGSPARAVDRLLQTEDPDGGFDDLHRGNVCLFYCRT